MPKLAITKTYNDAIAPTSAQLDAALDSIAMFFNVTGIGSDNLDVEAVDADLLSASSVTETKFAPAAVTMVKLAAQSVSVAKLAAEVAEKLEPSGIIEAHGGSAPPTGYLLCDGAAVSRLTYSDLFVAIGTIWGVGDGSTTFNLPDLRGRFLRGVDGTAGRDPNSAARTESNAGGSTGNNVGSVQLDDWKFTEAGAAAGTLSSGTTYVATLGTIGSSTASTSDPFKQPGPLSTTGSTTGLESRPENASVIWVIKT